MKNSPSYIVCECGGEFHPVKNYDEFSELWDYSMNNKLRDNTCIINKDCPHTDISTKKILKETEHMLLIEEVGSDSQEENTN